MERDGSEYIIRVMRVLVVEDDKKLAAFLLKGLREEQYAVDWCADGARAVEEAEGAPYDVLILDVLLPGKDGFRICRELREKGFLTPILMLTARDAVEDRVSGLAQGADDYLIKPFSFAELLARIRALLRRQQDYSRGPILTVGNLRLDPLRREVVRGTKKVELTGKEYALLEYLLRNKGRIVTQSMIIDHVWDMNYDGMSNIVNVYINHLRKKVDDDPSRSLIQTIRGRGYRIHEDSGD